MRAILYSLTTAPCWDAWFSESRAKIRTAPIAMLSMPRLSDLRSISSPRTFARAVSDQTGSALVIPADARIQGHRTSCPHSRQDNDFGRSSSGFPGWGGPCNGAPGSGEPLFFSFCFREIMLFWKFRFRAAIRVRPWRHSTFPPVSPIGAKTAGFGAPEWRDPGFSPAAEHGRRSRSQRPRGAKSLEKAKSGLADLQDLEIAQNRQRNVWMGLKKCLDGLGEKRKDSEKASRKVWRTSNLPESVRPNLAPLRRAPLDHRFRDDDT